MKIVVDAMGGDHGPQVMVQGAIAAVKAYNNIEVILVGDEKRINELLAEQKYSGNLISVFPALEVVEMHESAAVTIRKKRKSSMVVGINLVKEGRADAFFSVGNTGAVVCASALNLGLIEGVERPGIGIIMPTLKGNCMVIDVGANIDSKPVQLLQYGIMAKVYSRHVLKKENSTVGLLNVGEEESKGTDFIKQTYDLLSESNINFIGNVEGKDLFSGKCDIIICDGFVGNVALKVTEGLAKAMNEFLKRNIKNSFFGVLGYILLKRSFTRFKKEIDYSEYGGAPLLGVNGVVIIGHGRSNANAVKNAIRVAKEEVEGKCTEKIFEAIQSSLKNKIP